MSFLAPWALLFGALVAVPLLVHLRRREATRRVAFPAIRYLSSAREATVRSLRTSDLRLLAVRLALLLTLVLAAAGPLVGRGEPADHGPTDVALVVDNTASTGRVAGESTLLELLVERARQVVAAAGPGDRFWVLPAVGGPLAAGLPASEAAEALGRVPPSDGGAHMRAAVGAAAAALPVAEDRGREVILLGDLQASALRRDTTTVGGGSEEGVDETPSRADREAAGVTVRLLAYRPPEVDLANRAIIAVDLESGPVWPAGLAQSLVAEARVYPGVSETAFGTGGGTAGDTAGDTAGGAAGGTGEVTLRLEVNGRTVGAATGPWGAATAFRLPELPPGPGRGRITIEPDGLRADDARHFAFRIVPPPTVHHLGPPDGFLALALETLRADGRIGDEAAGRIGDEAAGRIGGGPAGRVRVVEAGGVRSPAGGEERSEAGVTVLVPPPDPVALPPFNQSLERAGVGWRLVPDSAAGELRLADGAGVPGLAGERVRSRYLLAGSGTGAGGPESAGEVLLSTEDGAPWLLRRRAEGRTWLLLLSPLVPEATTVPTSPAMIPFVEALILRWARLGEAVVEPVAAGEAVTLPPWVDSLRTPAGETLAVEGGAPFRPLRAGAYALFGREPGPPVEPFPAGTAPGGRDSGGGPAAYLAAGVPPAESDLRALEASRLQELFPGLEVDIAGPDPEGWRRALYRDRRGVAISPWLLGLALALAAVEVALAAPGRERERAG